MSLGTSNRDGGKTSESGHLRALGKTVVGDIIEGLAASQRAAGNNMSVDIAIGDAFLRRSDGTYSHPVFNDAVYNQAITAADGSNPRRDIVVMYVDYAQSPSTAVSNNTNGVIKIKVVTGTPAGSPADPNDAAIQSSVGSGNPWTKICRVRVPAGQTSISNSLIDDLRTFITPAMSAATKNAWLAGGWLDANETWTFSSWNSTNKVGVITAPSGADTRYAVDQFVRIVQSTGGTKYGRILALTSTSITVWMPNATLNNETISTPFYSMVANPTGAPKAITAGNPYSFKTYKSSNQTLNTGLQKYIFDTEDYDTTGQFDTTNNRFTAPVAGLYDFTFNSQISNGGTQLAQYIRVYINGTAVKEFAIAAPTTNGGGVAAIQLRLAAGDYVEMWANLSTGSFASVGGSMYSHFAGHYAGV